MNPRLLEYYNQELQHIRESAAEFAEEFPKIAGRLSLSGFECADPYVERLLEGFAYLTARVQLKLDAEYPTFTHNLLEIAYPHYLAPTPSMTVVQLRPDPNEGALSSGFSVERGASLRGQLGPDDQTACEYRTAHPVTLWPLEVAQADYFGNPAAVLGRLAASEPRAKAGLRIRLRSGAGIPFDSLSLDALPLYLHGADEQPYRLYEQLLGNACAVFVRAPDNAWVERLPTSSLRARGFDDEDALLPVVPRAFQGYRLLQEYFALPARFLFVEFSGLNRALRRCHGEELELVVLFGKHDQRLEGTVDAEQLVPFCTPAINLFPHRCDRIHLSDRVNEHHVIVDRTRPLDFEVHSLQRERPRQRSGATLPTVLRGARPGALRPRAGLLQRAPRTARAVQQAAAQGPALDLRRQRDLRRPGRRQPGALSPRPAPARHRRAVHQPRPAAVHADRRAQERLHPGGQRAGHAGALPRRTEPAARQPCPRCQRLAADQPAVAELPVAGRARPGRRRPARAAAALRRQRRSGAAIADRGPARGQQQALHAAPADARPIVFGRGLEITLDFDENAFRGTGVFLLGAVFERFLARYVSINSFTETVLRTGERGEVMRWQAKPGSRPNL